MIEGVENRAGEESLWVDGNLKKFSRILFSGLVGEYPIFKLAEAWREFGQMAKTFGGGEPCELERDGILPAWP